jgi:hypothetical protein
MMYRIDTSKEYTYIDLEQILPLAGRASSSLKVVWWVGQVRIKAFPVFGLAALVPSHLARFLIQPRMLQIQFVRVTFWITFWPVARC